MSGIEPNELTDSDSPLCCHNVECKAVSCSVLVPGRYFSPRKKRGNKRNIDESEPKFQPAPHVRATDTEIRLDSPAKRGVYDNFRFLSSNGLGRGTKKKESCLAGWECETHTL